MNRLKSPIGYFGGKNFAVPNIMRYVPRGITEAICPFIGGGSVELSLAVNGLFVSGGDAYWPVANFWQVLTDPERCPKMVDMIRELECVSKAEWTKIKSAHGIRRDPITQAAQFYILNNHCFSGLMMNATFVARPQRDLRKVGDLLKYIGLPIDVINADVARLLKEPTEQTLVFCDPPYVRPHDRRKTYGSGDPRTFDHVRLKSYLDRHRYWIITYDDDPAIHGLYEGYPVMRPDYLYYVGQKARANREIVIFSKALAEACPSLDPSIITYRTLTR